MFALSAILLSTMLANGWTARTIACSEEPFCRPEVVFTRGDVEQRLTFGQEGAYPASLDIIAISDANSIVILGVPGGSNAHFEIAVLDTSESRVHELLPQRITANVLDGIYSGTFGGRRGILVLRFLWEDEAHYAAHRYEATLYSWNGTHFVRTSVRRTTRKHDTPESAALELGYHCDMNFIARVVRARGY